MQQKKVAPSNMMVVYYSVVPNHPVT
jgi:hypothetical protein